MNKNEIWIQKAKLVSNLLVIADEKVFGKRDVTEIGVIAPCERHYPNSHPSFVPTYFFYNKGHYKCEPDEAKRIEGFMPIKEDKEYNFG